SVDNELEVRLLDEHRREDAELRGDILQALMLDSAVPRTVDLRVEEGFVTLTGSANWQHQRDEAEFVAGNVVGAVGIANEIQLAHPETPDADEVKEAIRRAFRRTAAVDAN